MADDLEDRSKYQHQRNHLMENIFNTTAGNEAPDTDAFIILIQQQVSDHCLEYCIIHIIKRLASWEHSSFEDASGKQSPCLSKARMVGQNKCPNPS